MNKKTIWITGGSTGIGKALALNFANKGWNVAISARRENLLKEIAYTNTNITSFPLDVTDKSKCNEVFEEIRKKTEDQISSEMENLYKESLNLRFQKSSGQLENTSRINKVRKLIARMKTVLNERSTGK